MAPKTKLLTDGHDDDLIPERPDFERGTGKNWRTLLRLRNEGRAPRHVRIGRTVFYRRRDVKEWLAAGGTR